MNGNFPDDPITRPHLTASEPPTEVRRAEIVGRVLVTRALAQSSALAEQLRARGLTPIVVPALELAEPGSFAPLNAALGELEGFHWLLFTSANAVEIFAERLGRAPANRIAAIGSATAQALTARGFRVDLLPERAVAESLSDALMPHVRQANGTPTRFLLIRAENARELLPETLRSAGAEVTVVPAYRTLIPQTSVRAIHNLFNRAEEVPDAITFTSASTVRNLLALCEATEVALPRTPLRISIGPITSAALREVGLPVDAEAPVATVESLAETTSRALQERLGRELSGHSG